MAVLDFKDREHLSSSSKPGLQARFASQVCKPRFQASFEARCSGHCPDRILPVYSADGLRPVRSQYAASWRDGGIECADRRRYDRLPTGCQEMQTKLFSAGAGSLCRSHAGVTLVRRSW